MLIVDDTPTNIDVLVEALADEHEIMVATGARQGLDLALTHQPDLILLDIMMPEMDGYTVCKRLKADVRTQEIPIVFMTALSSVENEEQGLLLGAIDYITKPFNPTLVRLRVRNHLEFKHLRDWYKNLSNRDGLTGIANRRHFDDTLHLEWRRADRAGAPLALVIGDIDYFKAYNDHYGHAKGDDCLRQVARALAAEATRPGDLVARIGGEEFGCLLPGTDLDGAKLVAERLLWAVRGLGIVHAHSGVAPLVTVSLGVATVWPRHETEQVRLMELADQNLYRAKAQGRNQCVWSPPGD